MIGFIIVGSTLQVGSTCKVDCRKPAFLSKTRARQRGKNIKQVTALTYFHLCPGVFPLSIPICK